MTAQEIAKHWEQSYKKAIDYAEFHDKKPDGHLEVALLLNETRLADNLEEVLEIVLTKRLTADDIKQLAQHNKVVIDVPIYGKGTINLEDIGENDTFWWLHLDFGDTFSIGLKSTYRVNSYMLASQTELWIKQIAKWISREIAALYNKIAWLKL